MDDRLRAARARLMVRRLAPAFLYNPAYRVNMVDFGIPIRAEAVDERPTIRFHVPQKHQAYRYRRPRGGARYQLLFPLVRVNFELGVIMVIAVSCVKLLSAHNSTQHTSRSIKCKAWGA
jgi:hypothetical protein